MSLIVLVVKKLHRYKNNYKKNYLGLICLRNPHKCISFTCSQCITKQNCRLPALPRASQNLYPKTMFAATFVFETLLGFPVGVNLQPNVVVHPGGCLKLGQFSLFSDSMQLSTMLAGYFPLLWSSLAQRCRVCHTGACITVARSVHIREPHVIL